METNGWRAPEYDNVRLTQEIRQQFSVLQGGAINPAAFYLDSYAAADFCALSQQSAYYSTHNPPVDWSEKVGNIISRHLRKTDFDQKKVDIIGLGVGDGSRETSLAGALLKGTPLDRLRAFLLDISPSLAMKAHSTFTETVGRNPIVQSNWIVGDMNNLPRYTSLFYSPEDVNILRVGTLFDVLGNVRHERSFIEQSLRVFKPGDLLIVEVSLGFAPADSPDLILKEDPSLNTIYGLEWLEGVIRRNRPQTQDIQFEFQLKFGASTFPKTYTIEIVATVDGQATFSIFQKHRYDPDEFIKTFKEMGWKPLEGVLYGYNKRVMMYVFSKK